MNNSVLNDILLFGGFALWAIPGYVGAVWLAAKGYTLELIGCTILAGGVPILLPAVLGPLMFLAAWLLPHKNRRGSTASPGVNIDQKTLIIILIVTAILLLLCCTCSIAGLLLWNSEQIYF